MSNETHGGREQFPGIETVTQEAPTTESTVLQGISSQEEREQYLDELPQADASFEVANKPEATPEPRVDIEEVKRNAEQRIHQMADAAAGRTFDAERTKDEIVKDLDELYERFGKHLSPAEWDALKESYRDSRNAARVEQMKDELHDVARYRARRDFNRDPGSGLSEQSAKELERIILKYADVMNLEQLLPGLQRSYQNSYNSMREHLYYNELNWFERRWYDFRGAVLDPISNFLSDSWAVIKNVSKALYATASAVVEVAVEVAKAAAQAVVTVAVAAKDLAVAAWEIATDRATYEAIYDFACDALETLNNVKNAVVEFVTDPKTWEAVKNGISAALDFVTDPKTWEAVKNGLGAAWDFATSRETWAAVAGGIAAAARFVTDPRHLLTLAKLGLALATDPIGCLEKAWNATAGIRNFLGEMSDAIGLTDLAVGLYNLAKAPYVALSGALNTAGQLIGDVYRVATGQMTPEQLKQNLKNNITTTFNDTMNTYAEGLRAIKGGILLIGEVTGITDLVLATKYALEGNWTMAAMHGAFAAASIGAITATIGTAGAAAPSLLAVMAGRTSLKNAAKQVLKTGAEKFLGKAAKEIGQQAIKSMERTAAEKLVKETGEKLSKEQLEAVGREALQQTLRDGAKEMVEKGSKELADQVLEKGSQALTTEAMENVMRDAAEEVTERILRDMGLDEAIDKLTYEMLKEAKEKSWRKLRKKLMNEGVTDKKAATEMAKHMKRAIKSPHADAAMKQILEDGITKEVKQYVQEAMEKTFKDHLRKMLKGELADESSQVLAKAAKEQAERLGKELDEFVDELVEAGWKGAKEGIEKAVRKVVREGLEKAFRRFRSVRPHIRPRFSEGQKKTAEIGVRESLEVAAEKATEETSESKEVTKEEVVDARVKVGTKTTTMVIDGREYAVHHEMDHRTGKWVQTGTVLVKDAKEASAEKEGKLLEGGWDKFVKDKSGNKAA